MTKIKNPEKVKCGSDIQASGIGPENRQETHLPSTGPVRQELFSVPNAMCS